MGAFIIVLILIVCFLLAGVILVQNPKGGGLATGFQGASQIGGVQKTADFLEKSTWYLTIGLFALCLLSAKFYGNGSGEAEGAFKEESSIDVIDQSGIDITNGGEPAAAPVE
ncbi:MAG: preprotein translocase subunit SecG [Flavobacteriales bacterium]|jgi:preprotein translocase subunit SecG